MIQRLILTTILAFLCFTQTFSQINTKYQSKREVLEIIYNTPDYLYLTVIDGHTGLYKTKWVNRESIINTFLGINIGQYKYTITPISGDVVVVKQIYDNGIIIRSYKIFLGPDGCVSSIELVE